jgi:hypothetical protein
VTHVTWKVASGVTEIALDCNTRPGRAPRSTGLPASPVKRVPSGSATIATARPAVPGIWCPTTCRNRGPRARRCCSAAMSGWPMACRWGRRRRRRRAADVRESLGQAGAAAPRAAPSPIHHALTAARSSRRSTEAGSRRNGLATNGCRRVIARDVDPSVLRSVIRRRSWATRSTCSATPRARLACLR